MRRKNESLGNRLNKNFLHLVSEKKEAVPGFYTASFIIYYIILLISKTTGGKDNQ